MENKVIRLDFCSSGVRCIVQLRRLAVIEVALDQTPVRDFVIKRRQFLVGLNL